MTNYVSISELTHSQALEIEQSAYELAGNVNLPHTDYDNIIRSGLVDYLVNHADHWASFDEEDIGDESYDLIINSYFASAGYLQDLLAAVRARKEDEDLDLD